MRVPSRVIAVFLLASVSASSYAELDDFILLDDDQTAEVNAEVNNEVGLSADAIWFHKDYERQDSAPIIQMTLIEAAENPEEVGSFSLLKETMRGMGEMEKILYVQYWFSGYFSSKTTATYRVEVVRIDDDLSAIFMSGHFLDTEGNVYEQYQYLAWAEDETMKCVIASEVEERLRSYYEDSVTDAMGELAALCYVGLNTDELADGRVGS